MVQHICQDGRWTVVGFYDDVLPLRQLTAGGPVLGRSLGVAVAYAARHFDELLLGIGYNHLAARQELFVKLAKVVPFDTFAHAQVWVDPSPVLGPGCFMAPSCLIDLNVKLGPNSFVHPQRYLAHDSAMAGHSVLSAAVILAGHLWLDERCYLSIGTTVSNNLRLGPDIRIGTGAVVVHDLTDPDTYVGIPARKMLPKA